MNENVYFECRKRAAIHNERLNSRAGAAEILGISESTLAHYELGITKNIPVGGDVEFENGQPVFIDGRTATAALPDNGAPVDVFAQMEQAKKEPVPVEQSQPQETKEPTQQAIPFEQQQEEQPQPMPDGTGFMMPDESAMDDLPWK